MSAHMETMTTNLIQYAKAAQALPMSWLTQAEFPAKPLVKSSFQAALDELPPSTGYADDMVRHALKAVVAGTDPRGGSFQAQATHAAAQLYDRMTSLALEPKVKKVKVRKGSVIHGYAGGLFGESYCHREVTAKAGSSIRFVYLDGPHAGAEGSYRGNLDELAEYLVPDHHCPEGCTLGQD